MEFIKQELGPVLNVPTAQRGKQIRIKYFTVFAHVLVTDGPLGCPLSHTHPSLRVFTCSALRCSDI